MNSCPICQTTSLIEKQYGVNKVLLCTYCDVHVLAEQPSKQNLDAYYTSSYAMSASEVLSSEHRRLFRLPEQARQYCKSIGLNIESDISAIHDQCNAITLWHVLEHFTEPRALLGKAHSLLNPNGLLFIRVPDFSSFWSRLLRQYWIWFQPQNHYVHYSKQSLKKLVEDQGFDIIQCISRRPNDSITLRAGIMADHALRTHFSFAQSFKKKLGRIYEHLTGIEIYLIARKR